MLVSLLLSAAFAQEVAQPVLDSQLYHQPVDSTHTLWTTDAGFTRNGYVTGRLVFDYVDDPLVYKYEAGDTVKLVDYALSASALIGVSYERVRLAIDIPVYLAAKGDLESGGGIGDVSLDIKGTLLDPKTAVFGLGLGARFIMPTANTVPGLRNGAWGWEVDLIADKRFGNLLVAANLGTKGVPNVDLSNVDVNDALFWKVGAGYAIVPKAGVSLDFAGQAGYADITNPVAIPFEGIVGGWGKIGDSLAIRGGVGTGITRGIGSPLFRAILGVGYEPPLSRDLDKDGIVDKKDSCPTDPEDVDTFQDEDGCPDPDNDNDGLLDANDQCPLNAEDLDQWKDEDGCPDPTTLVKVKLVNGKTGATVENAKTALKGPTPTEAQDGEFELELGEGNYTVAATLEKFLPLDAFFDVKNGPPQTFEFKILPDVVPGKIVLKVTDTKGKPVVATWTIDEGAAISTGESSVEPGKHQIVVRAEGYGSVILPAEVAEGQTVELTAQLQKSKVKVTKEKIDFKDKIFFETGNAVIKPESFPLLNEISAIILDRKDILTVRIEGHTDIRGSDADNLTLSDARAKSVKDYLIGKGIDAGRLNSIGYGETKPIDPANNAKAWEKNRRVEFFVEKWAEEVDAE